MKRLSTKVFLVSIGVAVMASALTALLVRKSTQDAVESAAASDLDRDSLILDEVAFYPFKFGSWDGIDKLVGDLALEFDRRIAVTSVGGMTLADSDPDAELPMEPAAFVDMSESFGFDEARFDACIADRGIQIEEYFDDPVAFDAETEDAIDECSIDAESDSVPSTLLYLGYREDTSVNLGDLNLRTMLLGAMGVTAAAGLGAVVFARQLSRPVVALTTAAGRLGAGDLSQRVDSGGSTGSTEVGELASAFNSMAARLEQTEAARTRIVSDIAHELRNPIGVLQGSLEAAQDNVFPTDAALIDTLHSEVRHLSSLVGDLQQLALSDVSGLSLRLERRDLADLAAEVVSSHSQADPRVAVKVDTSPTSAIVDPTRMRQVISNLLSNSLTHTPAGGTVTVSVRPVGSQAVIAVSDTGSGISADDLPMVFERLWRADPSRNRATGSSGLGLPICKAIVEAHNGTITARSSPGHGSTFTVTLPT